MKDRNKVLVVGGSHTGWSESQRGVGSDLGAGLWEAPSEVMGDVNMKGGCSEV